MFTNSLCVRLLMQVQAELALKAVYYTPLIKASMDPFSRSGVSNKQLKEEFVSNLSGSSMLEIAALMTIVPILVLLRRSISSKGNNWNWTVYMVTLSTDFLVLVLPVLLFFTVLADWTQITAIWLILLVLLCFAVKRFDSSLSYSNGGRDAISSTRTVLTSYRVLVMIMTCLCILAVDFNIFPRRYAKTETYGTSLMDLGVGSFVLANALVSRQARNVSRSVLSMKWNSVLQSTSPLIILGFGRLISTATVDYQVHVGEYGVHWNFFFTLAAVSILTSIIDINAQYCGALGFLILVGYQICLLCGLNDYLLSNKRTTNIFNQNKEGIFSIFGYWGMYLVGVHLGNTLFFGDTTNSRTRSNQWAYIRIWIHAIMFWLLTVILDKYVERVSRRMCNLAYVTFVLAQNIQALAILKLSDFLGDAKTLFIEEAFNRNLLAIFLVANVFTGLINMYVDTISASTVAALSIMIGYAFVLCILAGFAELSGIKLKFW